MANEFDERVENAYAVHEAASSTRRPDVAKLSA